MDFTSSPPESIIEPRTAYTRYGEMVTPFLENVGQWAVMWRFPVGTTNEELVQAKKFATGKSSMVRGGKGAVWKQARWDVRIAQPGGKDSDVEVWLCCLEILPPAKTMTEPGTPADSTETQAETPTEPDASADGVASDESPVRRRRTAVSA